MVQLYMGVNFLKANEVLSLLRITRPTLTKYVKLGVIKVIKLPNGRYDYDSDSVYTFLNKGMPRQTCIYARVSSSSDKAALEVQIQSLQQFCFINGYTVNAVYSDMASGVGGERLPGLCQLLNRVVDNQVERVVIMYKDRLSRTSFGFFKQLFEQYQCEIIVMSEVGSIDIDQHEIKSDLSDFLSNYSGESVRQLKGVK